MVQRSTLSLSDSLSDAALSLSAVDANFAQQIASAIHDFDQAIYTLEISTESNLALAIANNPGPQITRLPSRSRAAVTAAVRATEAGPVPVLLCAHWRCVSCFIVGAGAQRKGSRVISIGRCGWRRWRSTGLQHKLRRDVLLTVRAAPGHERDKRQ